MIQYVNQQQQHLNFTTLYTCKASHSTNFYTAITPLTYQLNAHIQLNIFYYYQNSPTCFCAYCTILRKNSCHLLTTSCLLWCCYIGYIKPNLVLITVNKHCKTHIWYILCFVTNVTISQYANCFEQVTGVLPEDGAVCAEACTRDLININIYSTVCVHLVGILKTKVIQSTLLCVAKNYI